MKIRIREGNDFDVAWAIKRGGMPEDLSSAINMKLTLVVHGLVIEHSLFTVTDNLLSINMPKEVTTVNGDYRLIFEYTLPDAGQPDGDLKCKTDVVPFRIVPFTAMADDIYTINVTSDIAFGFKGDKGDDGDDAYQIWLDLGNEGTYEDFIAYLRQPAVDAGASISELEGEIQVSEGLRVQAESERGLAEATRVQAENERLSAEIIRQSNEGNRIDNEDTRGQNEAERISEEGIRQSNEIDRIEAEGIRQSNEVDRVEAEGIRQSNEVDRVELYGDMIQLKAGTTIAKNNANNAAQLASEKAQLADEKAQEAIDAADFAIDATVDWTKEDASKDKMKFFNENGIPTSESDDGMYFVKTADTVMQYIVTDGNVYPLTSQDVFYGVERRRDVADPSFKKIGNSEMHETLPLHNLVRICKVNKNREVVNYFDQTDITKNEDGSPSVIDGSDGQDVAVHYPDMHAILDGGIDDEIWAIAPVPFEYKGIKSIHIKSFVESADYVTRDKTTGETRCIQSEDENFAGTGSGATDGGIGYPLTATSRYNYEVYAENKGEKWNNWLYVDYLVSQALMYIEYGTRYLRSSAIFGEIGTGWTSAQWSAYNSQRPAIKILEAHIGISGTSEVKAKGHLTGIYERTFDFEMDGTPTSVTSTFGVYRGKILWGHLYKHISGVEVEVQSDTEGGKSNVYVQFDPNKIDANRSNTSFDFIETYQLMGEAPRASGWARLGIPNSGVPATTGGGQSTYMTSYWYTSIPETGVSRRCLLVGLDLSSSRVGVGSADSRNVPSRTDANFGGGFRGEAK